MTTPLHSHECDDFRLRVYYDGGIHLDLLSGEWEVDSECEQFFDQWFGIRVYAVMSRHMNTPVGQRVFEGIVHEVRGLLSTAEREGVIYRGRWFRRWRFRGAA